MKDVKTNFIGPVNVTNAILPHMRQRREGTIVLIGSRSAYRQMVVSTFLLCTLRFVSKNLGDYIGPGYAPRLLVLVQQRALTLLLRPVSYSASKAALHGT
jgi:NAD(P)-dependent dehydrogenase (short-subunit alcohol dehydrogenase family)